MCGQPVNLLDLFPTLTVLDGCSRMIVAWDIRTTMREIDSEIVLQKARDKKLEDARERRRISGQKLSLKTNHNQRITTPAVASLKAIFRTFTKNRDTSRT